MGINPCRMPFSQNVQRGIMTCLRLLFVLFFPLAIFSSPTNKHYAESLVQHFQKGDFENSLRVLNEWESFAPEQSVKITGMKAAVYLSMGDFQIGKTLMDQFIQELSPEELSDPMMNFILEIYYKTFAKAPAEQVAVQKVTCLCKQEQPTGVKLRYWFGVGQILVGIIAAPFSGGASATLIFSGITTVVDAAGDALDNKANWERDLNDRQQMNSDIQRNSFYGPFNFRLRFEVI